MADNTITLAPASGAGIGKILAEQLLADPEFVPLMLAVAKDGLRAMGFRRFDKASGEWVSDPDMKVRTATFFGLLAHMEGEPIKRIVHQHLGGAVSESDLVDVLRDSPALLAAVERKIENAKFRTRNVTPKAAKGEDLDG